MSLIRWEPFGTMDELLGRMPPLMRGWPRLTGDGGSVAAWSPSVDISETDGEFLIKAELPAVKKEDVHVTFDDGMLTISGERKQEKEEKNEKFHRVERIYGSFARSFSLPEAIDPAAIRAETVDGVLTVHVPKTKTAAKKPTEIKIQ
ncbi:MAG TPA: Hsp20/alpha crystallin family protein [Steroidobacteraceae bacterium]|nr:Hsp20/alpha crystallin family protein [Steroidobacteraceae bacterium]